MQQVPNWGFVFCHPAVFAMNRNSTRYGAGHSREVYDFAGMHVRAEIADPSLLFNFNSLEVIIAPYP